VEGFEWRVVKLGIKRPAYRRCCRIQAARGTIISVDDHLMEAPHAFEGRLPAKLEAQAPRVVDTEEGHQVWVFEETPYFQVGFMCVAGRAREDQRVEPARFEELRKGAWDAKARIHDMDINGVWASLNYPSGVTGFGGTLFSEAKDKELGLACVRAWNDYVFDEWHAPYPDRIIPLGITFLADPEAGAAEIRRNAKRGFKAVTIPEQPHRQGLPPVFDAYWEPIIRACAETETVLSLHVGSSGFAKMPPGAPMLELGATLFGPMAIETCAEWLWSAWPVKHPDLKIAIAESGIGWVAMLADRSTTSWRARPRRGLAEAAIAVRRAPPELLVLPDRRPSTISTLGVIGEDHVVVESDYPHGDGTWPDTQRVMQKMLSGLPVETIRKLTHQNAAKLYRHPLPTVCRP
jgi:predicted TIM-barrel fold metal-dependent hydrolase